MNEVHFGWEWRSGRALEQGLGLKIIKIKSEGGGLFGIGRSPSLAGSIPDARRVQADVVVLDKVGAVKVGDRVTFRIPKIELKGANEGALAVVGTIGQKAVCFVPAPKTVSEESLADWMSVASCE